MLAKPHGWTTVDPGCSVDDLIDFVRDLATRITVVTRWGTIAAATTFGVDGPTVAALGKHWGASGLPG